MVTLPDEARRALEQARSEPVSYTVRLLRAPDGRLVAILGEAHMKLAKAAAIGKRVVSAFELRGVETFQRKKVFAGTALGFFISAPRTLAMILSFGALKGSTITDAKQLPSGYTVELERAKRMPFGLHVTSLYMTLFFAVSFLALFVPVLAPIAPAVASAIVLAAFLFQLHLVMIVPAILFRRFTWCWVLHPFLGILTLRDHLMVNGTVQMLADHPRLTTAVTVMGRAHVAGYERLLVDHHGFTRVDL